MRVSAIIVVFALVASFTGTLWANQIPIAVSGYTQNMVLGASETWPGTLTATMDGGAGVGSAANTWYAIGQNIAAPTTGLPAGSTVLSQSDPTTTLAIQPTGANNAILIDAADTTGAMTLTTPGSYSTLSLFGSTGNGANTVDYTLNFSNGAPQTGSVSFGDWFGSVYAYDANGRISSTGYNNVNNALDNAPGIYQVNVPFTYTPGLQLTSISLTQDPSTGSGSGTGINAGTGHTAIFALSGTQVVPEPSTLVIAGFGAIGLLAAARRRRGA